MTDLEKLKTREMELEQMLFQARQTVAFVDGALTECREMQAKMVADTAGSVEGQHRPENQPAPSKPRRRKGA